MTDKKKVFWKDVSDYLFVGVLIFGFLALFVGIPYEIYHECQIYKVPREYGYITSKNSDEPSVTVSFDVEYKGEIVTRKKIYDVTISEYMATDYGDVVYFDENNEPIFAKDDISQKD